MSRALEGTIYFDTPTLMDAQLKDRQQMLSLIVEGMLRNDVFAGITTSCLAMELCDSAAEDAVGTICRDTETSHGRLPTETTLSLLMQTTRLCGFMKSIVRWPEQKKILDVGCGPFPIFPFTAALRHPKAEITAVEINPRAAVTAAKFVEIFGLGSRINVVNTDISKYDIGSGTTAAVTETFGSGLQKEPGPKIVRLLHQKGIPLITPSVAELCLSLPNGEFYQQVDLQKDTHADISFKDWNSHETERLNDVNISTRFSDNLGVVLPYDSDHITMGLARDELIILRGVMTHASSSGRLTYELGVNPFLPRIEKPGLMTA